MFIKPADLVIAKELSAKELSSILKDTRDSVDLYQAYCLKDQAKGKDAPSVVEDSSVRYSALWSTDLEENQFQQDELLYSIDGNRLLGSHKKMTMHELMGERGSTGRRGFIEEVQLHAYGNKEDGAYIYCSRALDGAEFKVPSLMVLRYRKFTDEGMLSVDCMVRDEAIKIEQVIHHWECVIDNYVGSMLVEV